jgi:hypothetical protein
VDADVMKLASESGELKAITGLTLSEDRFTVLQFAFTSGVLSLGCDDDTDEIIVKVLDVGSGYPRVTHAVLADLIGMCIEYAWTLTNHRGYLDVFQLRLMDRQRREETRQFEVAASTMRIHRVVV